MRKMGAHYVISLVFFLYIFRLLGLAIVGAYGPVWATLLVELLNGPCYGLGFTAVVIYASKLSPPGTSTTVQSVVNICYEILGEHYTSGNKHHHHSLSCCISIIIPVIVSLISQTSNTILYTFKNYQKIVLIMNLLIYYETIMTC